jgi:anti-anti-sigma factor
VNNYTIIDIPDNFTVEEAAKFRIYTNSLIEEGNVNFILNFNKCEFIDSTGLGVIVTVYKRCIEHNGSVKLKDLKEQVSKLFKLTRLDKIFEIS